MIWPNCKIGDWEEFNLVYAPAYVANEALKKEMKTKFLLSVFMFRIFH